MVLGLLLRHCVHLLATLSGWFRPRRVTATDTPVDSESEPDSSDSAPGASVVHTVDPDSLPWWERTTSAEPGPAIYLLGFQLQSDSNERILGAYLRGRQAAEIKRGERGSFAGYRAPLRNRCYVVLWAPQTADPFITWDYPVYLRAVRNSDDSGFALNSISHAFPSLAEATAFCLGAGLRAQAPLR